MTEKIRSLMLCGILLLGTLGVSSCNNNSSQPQTDITELQTTVQTSETEISSVTPKVTMTESQTSIDETKSDKETKTETETESVQKTVTELQTSINVTETKSEADANFFKTRGEVENITNEELVELAFGENQTENFVLDYFDFEKESFGGNLETEERPEVYDYFEINENEEYKDAAERFFSKLKESNTTYNSKSSNVFSFLSKEFCGENDIFVEYKVSERRERSTFSNGNYETYNFDVKHRYIFLKHLSEIEINKQNIKAYFDLLEAHYDFSNVTIIYRDVTETKTEVIYTYYCAVGCDNDFGLNNVAELDKYVISVNKKTAEVNGGGWPEVIKEYEITDSAATCEW